MITQEESSRTLLSLLKDDADRHLRTWSRNSGLIVYAKLILLCPGFQLALSIRMQSACNRIPLVGPFVRRALWYLTTIWFGCDIDPSARFGPGIYFPHPVGIVIGGEWDIGANVSILQCVTLGRSGAKPSHRPQVGSGSQITAGAKVIGSVNIGAGATIGANAVVLEDVPAGSLAVGVPARILARKSRAMGL